MTADAPQTKVGQNTDRSPDMITRARSGNKATVQTRSLKNAERPFRHAKNIDRHASWTSRPGNVIANATNACAAPPPERRPIARKATEQKRLTPRTEPTAADAAIRNDPS